MKKTDFHVYWDVMTKKIFGHDYFSIPVGKNSYIYIAKPFLPLWFTDEAGNREPVAEKDLSDQQGKPYAECKHSPKEGALRQHIPLKNGGCEIRKYKASRCAKCRKILKKTLIQTIRNVTCTHK